ncbi:hypothetical protein BgiMline_002918 [Biomphalaria glabrata]|nr:hypothetical protein BgiMline_011491 [Biomphalaria glabrata]
MAFYSHVLLALIPVALWWMCQEIQTDKTFAVNLAIDSTSLYEFMKDPRNLPKIHPKIRQVSNLQVEGQVTKFNFTESYLLINLTFPMTLEADDTNLVLHYQTASSVADVKVDLYIKKLTRPQQSTMGSARPTVSVDGRLTIKAWRILSYMTCSQLVHIWTSTLMATSAFIPGS